MSAGATERTVRLLAPEGAEIGFVLATPGERAAAYALDVLLSQLILVLFVLGGLALAVLATSEHVLALLVLGMFVIRHGYFLFFETRYQGSTPGKRILGLRVVSRDGAQLGLDAIVARNVMRDLEVFLPLVLVLAPEAVIGRAPWWLAFPAAAWIVVVALLPFLTRERTRAGDLVAGTVVVRVPRSDLLRDQARGTRGARIRFSREQLAIYGEHELETLARLLRARDDGKGPRTTSGSSRAPSPSGSGGRVPNPSGRPRRSCARSTGTSGPSSSVTWSSGAASPTSTSAGTPGATRRLGLDRRADSSLPFDTLRPGRGVLGACVRRCR